MALQFSVEVKNGILNGIESGIGPDAILKIFSGSKPATLADPDSGDVLSSLQLPTSWMADASGGSVSKSGTWQDVAADGTGTAGHFRIYDDVESARIQGTITATGGGGDMTLDNTSVVAGQTITITSFTITAGN